jgi:hypothetical protein
VVAPALVLGSVIVFAMTLKTVGLIGATTLTVVPAVAEISRAGKLSNP